MNHEFLSAICNPITISICIVLALFLSVVILPLTGKNKSRKERIHRLTKSSLIFVGILVLCACLAEFILLFFIYMPFILFGFGLLSLIISLFQTKARTKGRILVTILIMLFAALAYFALRMAGALLPQV